MPLRTAIVALALAPACAVPGEAGRVLSPRAHHLGVAGQPEWAWFEGRPPESPRLDLHFADHASAGEQTLYLPQDDVKLVWRVELNGRRLGELHRQELRTVAALAVPAGTLREGDNVLSLVPPAQAEPPDDIVVGPIRLDARPLALSAGEAALDVTVTDVDGRAIPARVTVVDRHGYLPPLLAEPGQRLAVRPGVVYTGDGRARVALPAGRYTVYANRGFEWGVAERRVTVAAGARAAIALRIAREVPTPDLVASDTHVHTFTFSRHGDASDDERALTLAGEGIELPIATEHNQHSGYEEAARRMGVRALFTPVLGNEVTTPVGHFIAFPIAPGSPPADHTLRDWPPLLDAIRATPGVQVVILNHPRDLHTGFVPFAPENFDTATGKFKRPAPEVDALELVNSGTMRSDALDVYRDWFALLNAGRRLFGVGSSDSHDVNRSIVGMGRTYVACTDGDPGAIDVAQAAHAFRDGRLLVSLGLLANLTVDGRFGVGDVATGLGPEVQVTATVLGPSWTRVDRIRLYGDGRVLRDEPVSGGARPGEKLRRTWRLPRPDHDTYLVAVATGPGVEAAFWPTPRPYQPTSKSWTPYVIGSTNPVWIDGDGDGRYAAVPLARR